MTNKKSEELFARAQKIIPGGVNSPVRAFRGVGGTRASSRAAKVRVSSTSTAIRYIDYVGSWGPLLLGHRPKPVIDALRRGARDRHQLRSADRAGSRTRGGDSGRRPVDGDGPAGQLRHRGDDERHPRGARIHRPRPDLKFEGCYHGHVDSLLVKAGSGMATLGIADTRGRPEGFAETTIALPFNVIATPWRRRSAQHGRSDRRGDRRAGGRQHGLRASRCPGFWRRCASLTERHGALLIFDEVMTGFRLAFGGAQELYGISPDMTTLGKIIGGGLPIAAYGGRADIMSKVAPAGPIYQAGTLSGNPLAVAAGLAMLRYLKAHPEIYRTWSARGAVVRERFRPG